VGSSRPLSTAAKMAESTAILTFPDSGSDIISRHSVNGYTPVDFSIGRIIAHTCSRILDSLKMPNILTKLLNLMLIK
jgi:hypothetical protein